MRLLLSPRHLTVFAVVSVNAVSLAQVGEPRQSQLHPRLQYERIDVGTLGGLNTLAFDIDDKGRVFGVAQKATGGFTYFRWEAGAIEDLGIVPWGVTSPEMFDMSRHGQAVGTGRADGQPFAFLNEGSSTQELGFDAAVAVNKRGVVVGYNFHPTLSTEALLYEDGFIRNLT